MEFVLPRSELKNVKEPLILRVAPDKKLEHWQIIREGEKAPFAKGLSKTKARSMAVKLARRLVGKKPRRALLLIHKTRYIIERSLQLSHSASHS